MQWTVDGKDKYHWKFANAWGEIGLVVSVVASMGLGIFPLVLCPLTTLESVAIVALDYTAFIAYCLFCPGKRRPEGIRWSAEPIREEMSAIVPLHLVACCTVCFIFAEGKILNSRLSGWLATQDSKGTSHLTGILMVLSIVIAMAEATYVKGRLDRSIKRNQSNSGRLSRNTIE